MSARFGLIGSPLTHSFSPAYFNKKFSELQEDFRYEAFPLDHIHALPALLAAHPELRGLNVTIPFKTEVISFLDAISEEAAQIGAVNCIRIEAGKLIGYNTDVYGFSESLKHALSSQVSAALILGNGGSAKAVKAALKAMSVPFRVVSRSGTADFCYDELNIEIIAAHELIINTSPIGMFPNTEAAPEIPYEGIGNNHFLFDLIYNPEETLFLRLGKQRGASTKNGSEMLVLQAERSWEIWTGEAEEPIKTILRDTDPSHLP